VARAAREEVAMRASWSVFLVLACAGCASEGPLLPPPRALDALDTRIDPGDTWLDVASPVGREEQLLGIIERKLSGAPGTPLSFEHDAVGSLIVRVATEAKPPPPKLLLAVGVDEPTYVISQIREDGLLRLRTLARNPDAAFHLAHEGRPVDVWTRTGTRPGVIVANSVHLRAPRPDPFGESALWLDVGADSPADVAALGIELLDPVVQHEGAQLGRGRFAEPAAGARAAVRALVNAIQRARGHNLLPSDVAVAFVAQSQVNVGDGRQLGTTPLGRGGEAVVRLLHPATTVVLRGAEDTTGALVGPTPIRGPADTEWQSLELRVAHLNSPVELVEPGDVAVLDDRLDAVLGGGQPAEWGPSGTPMRTAVYAGAFATLHALVEPTGVSGHEEPVRTLIRRALDAMNPDWHPVQDAAGNLVLTLGEGPTTYAFVAHMDEIGLEVTKVRDDGLLEAKRVGGMIETLFRDTVVNVVTRDGQLLAGISCPKPKDAPKDTTPPSKDTTPPQEPVFVLDVGARTAAEAGTLGVAVGDTATVPKELRALGAHRAAGRSNDDRVGDTALLRALHELGPDADARLRAAGHRVVFAWTTREETGLDGADALARALRPVPRIVFAVDTFVTSDSPIEDPRYAFARLGDGPVLRALDNTSSTPKEVLDRVREVAARAGVPLQEGVMGGGNDGSRFVPEGAIDCPLAWPQRCSHSRVETLDLRDLERLAHLIAALAQGY
jgi:putative aminopeptidase